MEDERKWASQETLDEIAALAAARDHRLGPMQTGARPLTSASAEKILAYLRARPRKPGAVIIPPGSEWQPVTAQEAEAALLVIGAPARTPAAARQRAKVTRDGFFEYQGNVYKVQRAVVTGSGHLYAKRFDPVSKKFVMAPGMMSRLSEASRLGPGKTAYFGRLYGTCLDCGSPLTDEESIARGRGAICEGKLGERSWY